MAENSGRGNSIDAADAPRGGAMTPPPVNNDVKGAVRAAAAQPAAAGEHASGQEPGMQPDPRTKVERKEEVVEDDSGGKGE
ncbi:hypothetical protein F5Y14DRAFT_397852 [Nemania sp. NC0429]|nr:hypothetical protein F5Y14DRAFT_397852 [Nemania sp. NC0429]